MSDEPVQTEALTQAGPQPMKLKLVVASGPDFGTELRLDRGMYRVGNEAGNELVLTDKTVSRTHLMLEVLPRGVRITDNKSRNGSFCQGLRFEAVEVAAGAVVRIGRTDLKVVPADAPAQSLAPSSKDRFGDLLGKSLVMRELFAVLERAAESNVSILIEGSTGTGKEKCAKAIHAHSSRSAQQLVVCDLSAMSPNLIESELFGHVRGAFTGAVADRAGSFQRAHGGTVFLDEVAELPLDLQPRLLRALENGQIKRVGDSKHQTVDVRVIAATNRDLAAEVAAGRFREDLFHRLAVLQVRLPDLKQRREDIPLLVDDILQQLGKKAEELTPETRMLFYAHEWPGNVRELKNTVERAVALGGTEATAQPPGTPPSTSTFREIKQQMVDVFERDYLFHLLKRCEGNISLAAREAGIDRVHLHRLVKKHGLGTGES